MTRLRSSSLMPLMPLTPLTPLAPFIARIVSICIQASCASMLLSACANMSGLGGSSEYGCKAPQGVQCDSVSGNYYNAIQNNLPSQRQRRQDGAAGNGSSSGPQSAPVNSSSVFKAISIVSEPGAALPSLALSAAPLRSQARVLRLWFKPWEDADHDLYDQGYVYVQIDSGRWLIDHAQQRIRDAYAQIRPPHSTTLPASVAAAPASANLLGPGPGASGSDADPSAILATPLQNAASMPGVLPAHEGQ